jgi:DNA replication protein DnaC
LILDDWGLEPLDAVARHDLLEILEERYGRHSTMITSVSSGLKVTENQRLEIAIAQALPTWSINR